MFSGHGGTAADAGDNSNFVQPYLNAGYQVVQTAWAIVNQQGNAGGRDWEYASSDRISNPNIRNAACRPATFLSWVRNGGVVWTTGGMCAQGFSAGAGALAHAIAWYGAADQTKTGTTGFLDKVELLSGPELADVKQGCEIDGPGNGDPYAAAMCPSWQYGCMTGTHGWPQGPNGQPIFLSLEFTGNAVNDVGSWTAQGGTQGLGPGCANNAQPTTSAQNSSWANMSVVQLPAQNGVPNFNYPKTNITAWLCQSTANNAPQNNSGSQGEIFYQQITGASQALSYSVNAVSMCPSAEDVNEGNYNGGTGNGATSIVSDMTTGSTACKKNTGH